MSWTESETNLIIETLKRVVGKQAMAALFAPLSGGELIRLEEIDYVLVKFLCKIFSMHFKSANSVWAKDKSDLKIRQPSVIVVDAIIHGCTGPIMQKESKIDSILGGGHRLILCNFSVKPYCKKTPKKRQLARVFKMLHGTSDKDQTLKKNIDEVVGVLGSAMLSVEEFESRVNYEQILIDLRRFAYSE